MKQTTATKKKDTTIDWHLIDAKGKPLGRVAVEIVKFLIGKHKVNYAPYFTNSDKVVVINSRHVALTGKKEFDKVYRSNSRYVGNMKTLSANQVRESNPNRLIIDAVKGMLPKNRLRDQRVANIYIYPDAEHKHGAQLKNNGGKE